MAPVDLTPEQWQWVSVVIANEIRKEKIHELDRLASRHELIWEKIQPACEWPVE